MLDCGFAEISTAAYRCFPALSASSKIEDTFDILKFSMIVSLRGHKQTMFHISKVAHR